MQEAGETPEFAGRTSTLPILQCGRDFLFWPERQSLQVEIVIVVIINLTHRTL